MSAQKAEIVRELEGWKGRACLVRKGDDYFAVSSVDALFTGPETLVFPATAEGDVTKWLQVAGGSGMTRQEAIAELEAQS